MIRFLLSGLLLLPAFAFGQAFSGGLFAGGTTSQVNGDGLAGFDIAGFQFGAFSQLQLREKSTLTLELGFVQKGAQEPPSDTSNFYRLRLNYINIPLLYTYRFGNLGISVGPALDILVNYDESDISGPRPDDPDAQFRTISLVGVSALSYHFNERWSVQFKSSISVTPMRDGVADAGRPYLFQAGGPGQRNLMLSTCVYYRFERN